ncbi:MAG: helix-turn-helix domain-containing protein [Aeromicrobium sp.]
MPEKYELPEHMITLEVADFLRTSPETVRYWRHIGKGPRSFKVGRRVLYDRADVAAWLEAAKSGDPVAS